MVRTQAGRAWQPRGGWRLPPHARPPGAAPLLLPGHGSFASLRSVSGNGLLATAELPWLRGATMEAWGCPLLLLLAVLSPSRAQLKRQRLRELDPVWEEMTRLPGPHAAGEPWADSGGRACPFFSLPLWTLLGALSGSFAVYVLRFRGRGGGTHLGSKPDIQSEAAFLRDVLTVLSIIRNRLSQTVQDRRGRPRPQHTSKAEGA